MIQNIALATEALGLGGFPHYGAHRFAWTRAFGFRMVDRTFAEVLHKGFFGKLLMKLMGKNVSIPQAVGIDHDGGTISSLGRRLTTRRWRRRSARSSTTSSHPGPGIFRDSDQAQRVARPGHDPVRDPAVLGGEHPGGHRLLRVRP